MSDRQPATEKGTADRVEADDGGYWVRLVTKQALKREGVCMGNCLADGYRAHTAGEEDMICDAVWSLRKASGVSYLTVDMCAFATGTEVGIGQTEGPRKSNPSAWSCRQFRHLVAAFRAVGVNLTIPENIALTGEDGRTWRPDKAPQDVKDASAARQQREAAERLEAARARGDTGYLVRNDPHVRAAFNAARQGIVGDGPINPPVEGEVRVSVINDGMLIMTEALNRGLDSGLIHRINVDGGETVLTLRISGPVADTLVANGDGTYALYLEGRDQPASYPVVIPTGDVGFNDEPNTVRVRLQPTATGVRRRYTRVPSQVDGTVHGHIRDRVAAHVAGRFEDFARATLERVAQSVDMTYDEFTSVEFVGSVKLEDEATIRSGIELDAGGSPVTYWVHPAQGRRVTPVRIGSAGGQSN